MRLYHFGTHWEDLLKKIVRQGIRTYMNWSHKRSNWTPIHSSIAVPHAMSHWEAWVLAELCLEPIPLAVGGSWRYAAHLPYPAYRVSASSTIRGIASAFHIINCDPVRESVYRYSRDWVHARCQLLLPRTLLPLLFLLLTRGLDFLNNCVRICIVFFQYRLRIHRRSFKDEYVSKINSCASISL